MHNANLGMVRRTWFMDSMDSSYRLVRCIEYLTRIEKRSELAHQARQRSGPRARYHFLRDSLSKLVEVLD
jgi:hypothetical protein